MRITKRPGKRTTMRSLINHNDIIFIDKLMMRSIKHNMILFKGLRDIYSTFGWIMLTKYYASFAWSYEKTYRYFGLDKATMMELYEYSIQFNSPFDIQKHLTNKDVRIFEISSNVLIIYLEKIIKTIKLNEDAIYITKLIDN